MGKMIKVTELTGTALDWAVAICEGIPKKEIYTDQNHVSLFRHNLDENGKPNGTYTTGPALIFSRKWEAGGPIIEREKIALVFGVQWCANIYPNDGREPFCGYGDTTLEAAMRCYVTSKLGDEVEIPEKLL